MEYFRGLFSETAEVISESEQGESPSLSAGGATNRDILSLLSRRPCTVRGVSSGLGLHPEEVSKRLHALSKQGAVVSVRRNDVIFYEAVRHK
jgi:DNA-binding transcriptional ArsR family regulator